MVIQHNMPALNAKDRLKRNNSKLAKSAEKLSSCYAINRAGDNAAGLAVSEKMRSQIVGLKQSIRNSQDGISLIQTFEGALGETVAIIRRAKELAVQSANETYQNDIDRKAIEIEYLQLCDEINHIAETDFNGIVMLTGGKHASEIESFINSENNFNVSTINNKVSEAAQQAAAVNINAAKSSNISLFSSPRTGGTVCGDFTVYGDSSNYSFDSASGVLTILGGDVAVEGTGAATANTIVVAKDKSANVTLSNVNIDVSSIDDACAFKIEDDSLGDVTLTLEGDNYLSSGKFCAGLQKNGGNTNNIGTLVIVGNGILNARGGDLGAGIGGGNHESSAYITISGGKITAVSSGSGAGIGGGDLGDGKYIEINGGEITAISEFWGAGIGGGCLGYGYDITINDGTERAESRVITTGTYVPSCGGAGIGGGQFESGRKIKINGGSIVAIAYDGGAGIGGGAGLGDSGYGEVTITGGTVTALSLNNCSDESSDYGSGIGGGVDSKGKVVIEGEDTVVMAESRLIDGKKADDIGSGSNGDSADVTIKSPLIAESYSGGEIKNGTIIHNKNAQIPSNPTDDPKNDTPNNPENTNPNHGEAVLTYTENLVLQVGSHTKDSVNFTFAYHSKGLGDLTANLDCTANGLGMDELSLATQEEANFAIDKLDNALNKVSMIRSTFGAAQNRLEHKIANLNNTTENLTSSESSIRDTDIAKEIMEYTKEQILSQCSQAMLSQANSLPQGVLSLITG